MAARNALEYGALAENNWIANLNDITPFKPKFTFYSDFSIAEFYETRAGERGAVKETYDRVIEAWGNDYEALTEIVLVLNHKSWAFHNKVDNRLMGADDSCVDYYVRLYAKLYEEADDLFYETFKNDKKAMDYYYEVTD